MKLSSWVVTLSVGVCIAGVSKVASAAEDSSPEAPRFGQQGQLVIGSDANGSVIHNFDSNGSSTVVSFNPAVDYFVSDHLSLGVEVPLSYGHGSASGSSSDSTNVGFGPRVGYDVPLSNTLSLWPRVSFLYETLHSSESGNPSSSSTAGWVEAYAPVLYHPAPHFFVGIGPYVEQQVIGDDGYGKVTSYGARITLGGWVGL